MGQRTAPGGHDPGYASGHGINERGDIVGYGDAVIRKAGLTWPGKFERPPGAERARAHVEALQARMIENRSASTALNKPMPIGIWLPAARTAMLKGMKIRTVLACAVMALGAVTLDQSRAQADVPSPTPVPATPGAWINGVGHFTYDEPGVEGHRIRFSIHARVATNGTARGVFGYQHLLPDGQEIGAGFAEVTCVHVHNGTALVAAVVPEGQGNVPNHGFYVKIIEGDRWQADRIETLQAGGGDERPPRFCVDPAEFPGINRYPLNRGGYAFGS